MFFCFFCISIDTTDCNLKKSPLYAPCLTQKYHVSATLNWRIHAVASQDCPESMGQKQTKECNEMAPNLYMSRGLIDAYILMSVIIIGVEYIRTKWPREIPLTAYRPVLWGNFRVMGQSAKDTWGWQWRYCVCYKTVWEISKTLF